MKKRVLAMACSFMLLMGSSMTVCAEETPTAQMPLQNYQQMMTPEILASFQGVTLDSDLDILADAVVRRTDVWGSLQDADGDGIDDRDPINGCGYLDLNCNGFDDRFEMEIVNVTMQEDPQEGLGLQMMLNALSHRCSHGITASCFVADDDIGYMSFPDYFDQCPECTENFSNMIDMINELW